MSRCRKILAIQTVVPISCFSLVFVSFTIMQSSQNRLSDTPQEQSPHSNRNVTNQSTTLRTGEDKILPNLVQELKLMKHLLSKLSKIPYHPEAGMNKEEESNKFIIIRLILTDIKMSRFVMNVLIPELDECEMGLQFIDLKETSLFW